MNESCSIMAPMMKKIKDMFWGENEYRLVIVLVFLALFSLFLVSESLKLPANISYCNGNNICEWFSLSGLAELMYNSLPYLLISIFLLVFFSKDIFKFWLKTMLPAFLVFIFVTTITPKNCEGLFCFSRNTMALGFSILFLVITVLIVWDAHLRYDVVEKVKKIDEIKGVEQVDESNVDEEFGHGDND